VISGEKKGLGIERMGMHPPRGHEDAESLFLTAERLEEEGKFSAAFRRLLRAATLGHSGSQVNLGNYYASGTGVRKNLSKAAYWYKAAYRQGNSTAARNLAIDRLSIGNIRSAIQWFKKGIEQEDGGSYIGLAKIYASRRGGKEKAIKLLERVRRMNRTHASELDQEQAKSLLAKLKGGAEVPPRE
jgi:hypothetical protein